MGVIKSNQAPASASPFSLRDIERQAQAMLRTAERDAQALLAAARSELDALREAARHTGHAAGRAQGLAEGAEAGKAAGQAQAVAEAREMLASLAAALAAATAALDESRVSLELEARNGVVCLAAAMARKVAHRVGSLDPRVVRDNLHAAIARVIHAADVRIAFNPSQRADLERLLPELRTEMPHLAHVELVDDASVLPGGCRVFTGGGRIDADLDAQLDRIVAELLPPEPVP